MGNGEKNLRYAHKTRKINADRWTLFFKCYSYDGLRLFKKNSMRKLNHREDQAKESNLLLRSYILLWIEGSTI